MKVLSKITVKTVTGGKPDIEKILAHPDKVLPLMEVVGIGNGLRAGIAKLPDGTESPFTKLLGSFQAVNLETGEISRSGVCILPALANNLVAGALENPEVKGVEFAFRLSARYVKDKTIPFEYVAESLTAPKETDPLEQLTKRIAASKVTALPSPTPTPTPAPEPAKASGGKR